MWEYMGQRLHICIFSLESRGLPFCLTQVFMEIHWAGVLYINKSGCDQTTVASKQLVVIQTKWYNSLPSEKGNIYVFIDNSRERK